MNFLSEAVAKLSAVPEQLEKFARGLSEDQLSWKPAAEVFSIRENILHIRDIDVEGYEKRIRLVLSEDKPVLPDVDGGKLARERNYNQQPIEPALAELRRSREGSMSRLAGCSEQDLDRLAEMESIGRIDLRRLLQLWMQHDAEHLADVEQLRRVIETGRPGTHLPNAGLRADAASFRVA